MEAYIRRRPFFLSSPFRGPSSPVSNLILTNTSASWTRNRILDPHNVDFPAPFGPTTAIRESRPTSISMFLRRTWSALYPKLTPDNWSNGGGIFSASGNLRRARQDTDNGRR